MNKFVALDIETANADMSSICQIGLAAFNDGQITQEWVTYINPQDYFDPINVSIHGITESAVVDAPTFSDAFDVFCQLIKDQIVVCHTHFDRVAIQKTIHKLKLSMPEMKWLDSARVARRAWEQFAYRGYSLSNISSYLKYVYKEHDALDDAKAAGNVILAAISETGLNIEQWLARVDEPISGPASTKSIQIDGNPEGPLFGEILVFTGALTIPRREAAILAASIGCTVTANVTKNTTLLIVGNQDITRLAGESKSSKHRKAEQLIGLGQKIRILKEEDFQHLVDTYR